MTHGCTFSKSIRAKKIINVAGLLVVLLLFRGFFLSLALLLEHEVHLDRGRDNSQKGKSISLFFMWFLCLGSVPSSAMMLIITIESFTGRIINVLQTRCEHDS